MGSRYIGQQHILDFIMSHVQEASQAIDKNTSQILRDSLVRYLAGETDRYQCEELFRRIIGSAAPVDNLRGIIETDIGEKIDAGMDDSEESDAFLRPVTGPGGRRKSKPWTVAEDRMLLAGILHNGIDKWNRIAEIVGGRRTRAQCSQRWLRGLDPRISKKKWSKEEDTQLFELVDELGETAWAKIAQSIGNRSDVQCRYHYMQLRNSMRWKTRDAAAEMSSPEAVDRITSKEYRKKGDDHAEEGRKKSGRLPLLPVSGFHFGMPIQRDAKLAAIGIHEEYSLDAFLHHFGI